MHFALAARRTVAVAAATAMLTTGGVAGGLLSSAALAVGEPAVSSATPAADNNGGNSLVTINGAGFVPATDGVVFTPNPDTGPKGDGVGSIQATVSVPTSTPTALKVTVPLALAAPGAYDIVVTQSGLVGACGVCFTVTSNGAPGVSGVVPGFTPSGGSSRGDRPLDINGNFFAIGAKIAFLTAAGTADPGLAFTAGDPNAPSGTTSGFPSSGKISGNYRLPSGTAFTPGKHQLRVTNTDGQSGATAEFWQPTFAAGGVSPTSMGAGTHNRVITVTGDGIRPGSTVGIENLAGSGSDVSYGAATVSADGTSISEPVTFTTGATQGTLRAVTVSGPDGGLFSVPGVFRVTAPPTITSLNIDTLGQGAVQDIAIAGTNFATGGTAGLPTFTFDGTGVTAVTKSVAVSAGVTTATLTATVAPNATVGGRAVTVTNPDGGSMTCAAKTPAGACATPSQTTVPAFNVAVGPVATSVSPASSPAGTTRTMVVQGDNFDGIGMDLVFAMPPATGQPRTQDPTLSVGAVTVTDNTSPVKDTASFSLTMAANAPAGLRDIVVKNKGNFGTYVCAGCFGIDSLSVSPAAGANTGTIQLTAARTGLVAGSTIELVRAGDPAYQPHLQGSGVAVSSSGLTASFNLTNAAPGPYNAIVTSGSSTFSCSACFTVTGSTPTLTSLTPNTGGQGAVNRAVTLTGTKFSRGEQVTIAGLTVHDVTFVSPTQLSAQIDIPAAATTGAKDVKVLNADGQGTTTLTGGFTVGAAPVPSGSTPASYGQGAKQQTITVTGPGFVTGATGQPSSTVDFGAGITVTKVVVTQGTMSPPLIGPDPDDTLVATVDIAETAVATQRNVKVSNPDGGVGTLVNGFTVNPGPTVTAVTPAVLAPGTTGKTLTITGAGFSTTAGKTAVPTIAGLTLTNPTVAADGKTITVTAAVDAATAKGLKNVVVTNPTDQGAGTCVACFAVASAPTVPTNVAAQPGSSTIVVSWGAPTDNGGAPVTSYVVSAKDPAGAVAGTTATVDGAIRSATLTGFATGTTYTISVIARNAAGDSPAATTTATTGNTGSIPEVTVTVGIISAGQGDAVIVTGTPGQSVQLLAASKPGITFQVAQVGVLDSFGRKVFVVSPKTNTRLFARSAAGSGAIQTIVVRSAVALTATATGRVAHFSGTVRPIRPNQVVVFFYRKGSLYVVVGKVYVASNGTYSFSRSFAPGGVTFFTQTGTDAINATGKSPDRHLTFS